MENDQATAAQEDTRTAEELRQALAEALERAETAERHQKAAEESLRGVEDRHALASQDAGMNRERLQAELTEALDRGDRAEARVRELEAAGNQDAKVLELTGKLAAAQAVIDANLLDWPSFERRWKAATAEANEWLDGWKEIEANEADPDAGYHDEAVAIVKQFRGPVQRAMRDADKAGKTPAQLWAETGAWTYEEPADDTADPSGAGSKKKAARG